MKITDRDNLTFLGSHYYWLQGLRIVPLGVMLVLWFFLDPLWPKSNLRDSAKLLSVVAVIAGYYLLRNYYERNFGVVRQQDCGLRSQLFGVGFLAVGALCYYLEERQNSISFLGLWWGLFFLYLYSGSLGRRKYCIWIAGLLFVVSLLPLTGIISVDQIFGRIAWGNLAIGIAFVALGILDHRLLVRSLPEPTQVADD